MCVCVLADTDLTNWALNSSPTPTVSRSRLWAVHHLWYSSSPSSGSYKATRKSPARHHRFTRTKVSAPQHWTALHTTIKRLAKSPHPLPLARCPQLKSRIPHQQQRRRRFNSPTQIRSRTAAVQAEASPATTANFTAKRKSSKLWTTHRFPLVRHQMRRRPAVAPTHPWASRPKIDKSFWIVFGRRTRWTVWARTRVIVIATLVRFRPARSPSTPPCPPEMISRMRKATWSKRRAFCATLIPCGSFCSRRASEATRTTTTSAITAWRT